MTDATMATGISPGSTPLTARLAEWIRDLRRDLTDPYRPELHYMRGPGPKWREKHGQRPAPDASFGSRGSPQGICQTGA
jgi:hypothetical protein